MSINNESKDVEGESECEFTYKNGNKDFSSLFKKTWKEMRESVQSFRKKLACDAGRNLSSFRFINFPSVDGDAGRDVLFFLGTPNQSRDSTLMFTVLPDEIPDPPDSELPWCSLLSQTGSFHATEQFSKQEQLLRERKRLDTYGIDSYDIHGEANRFLFPLDGCLWTCDIDKSMKNFLPQKIPSSCPNVRLDPKFCPAQPNWVSFIHDNDIWLVDISTGVERRLTFAHSDNSSSSRYAGVASYISQEEFHRFTGYWWQPKMDSGIERILYEEVDESEVMSVSVFTSAQTGSQLEQFTYPRAGTLNASVSLKMLEIEKDSFGQVGTTVNDFRLREPLSNYLLWYEYIVRAGWTPGGEVWAVVLNRVQNKLALVLIPIDFFVRTTVIPYEGDSEASGETQSRLHILYEESSQIWLKVNELLYFLPQTDKNEIKFLWGSEMSGFRHLYLVTSSLAVDDATNASSEHHAKILSRDALTSGTWEISPSYLWVNEVTGNVFVVAVKDTVLENHLYVTSYANRMKLKRLTDTGFSHYVQINKECSKFVTVNSSIVQPPVCSVYNIVYSDNKVSCTLLATVMKTSGLSNLLHVPELFTYPCRAGHTGHGLILKPCNFESGKKYPVVLFVYGGPEVQLVTNSFKGVKFVRLYTLAAEGYVTVMVDGRGSSCRGLLFEGWIKHRLGTVEIEDQVEGLQWIASFVNYIDLNRVAIHGWSYGGYLSLLGLAQRPDVFKVAIAGAPVVNWTLYDTAYTERYMDLPGTNEEGYKHGSVLSYVDSFPDEANRLLIIQGLMDENVHFQHSATLIDALIKRGKPYQLQVYPSERHGIRDVDASDHYKTSLLYFLQENL